MIRPLRHFRLPLLSLLLPSAVMAQQAAPLTVHPIKDGKLYWVEGGGGNSGVVIGDTGVIVIDAKINADTGRALVAEIAKLTPKPITHLIETHSDGDHVNGVAGFPAGVKIIGHINNKNDQIVVPLTAVTEINGGKCLPPQDRLPNMIVYKDKVTTTIDGERVELYHFGPAHTNGDLIVYLPAYKLAFAGDILTTNVLIHSEKNGSLDGWFRNAKGMLALGATTYVAGHAAATFDTPMVRKRIAEVQATRDKVDGLVDQGKSLADIKAAMGDPPKDTIGCRGIPFPSLAWQAYQDRTDKAAELK